MRIAVIVGGLSRVLAPWSDPAWKLAGMNDHWSFVPDVPEQRFAYWVEIHKADSLPAAQFEWLSRPHPFPIFMQAAEVRPEFPSAVAFPLEEIQAKFPRGRFTASTDYAAALAIHLGAQELGLFGADAPHDDARAEPDRLAALAGWLGLAEGRGIRVNAPLARCFGPTPPPEPIGFPLQSRYDAAGINHAADAAASLSEELAKELLRVAVGPEIHATAAARLKAQGVRVLDLARLDAEASRLLAEEHRCTAGLPNSGVSCRNALRVWRTLAPGARYLEVMACHPTWAYGVEGLIALPDGRLLLPTPGLAENVRLAVILSEWTGEPGGGVPHAFHSRPAYEQALKMQLEALRVYRDVVKGGGHEDEDDAVHAVRGNGAGRDEADRGRRLD